VPGLKDTLRNRLGGGLGEGNAYAKKQEEKRGGWGKKTRGRGHSVSQKGQESRGDELRRVDLGGGEQKPGGAWLALERKPPREVRSLKEKNTLQGEKNYRKKSPYKARKREQLRVRKIYLNSPIESGKKRGKGERTHVFEEGLY